MAEEALRKGLHEAAQTKEAKEGQEALDLKTSEDTAATTRFETHTAKIDGILTTDLKYLEDEPRRRDATLTRRISIYRVRGESLSVTTVT